MANKQGMSRTACFARGGAVIGKVSEFIKTPDHFRGFAAGPNTYGKGGKGNPGQAKGRPNPTVTLPKGK